MSDEDSEIDDQDDDEDAEDLEDDDEEDDGEGEENVNVESYNQEVLCKDSLESEHLLVNGN